MKIFDTIFFMNILQVTNLTKRFGNFLAVENISFFLKGSFKKSLEKKRTC